MTKAGQLLNLTMHDGSRHFGDLPQSALWYAVRDHVGRLPGAKLIGFVTDHVTEAWIDFTYQGHTFFINDQYGHYWFFVQDTDCPDDILHTVLAHFRQLLDPEGVATT
ncbi:MAG: hypothetical protein L0332_15500 [Chloroflexi bacterium]|nr:hypothetical protein [Chloroflexota bacterium]MCI0648934.1 hypothetical protein [Chloroflexota bacterium]MCI0728108.1 hypothetical protein [Chloroflexota bacterium]